MTFPCVTIVKSQQILLYTKNQYPFATFWNFCRIKNKTGSICLIYLICSGHLFCHFTIITRVSTTAYTYTERQILQLIILTHQTFGCGGEIHFLEALPYFTPKYVISLPYFRPDPKFNTLFHTRPLPYFVCVNI